jgi:hypothetical protein
LITDDFPRAQVARQVPTTQFLRIVAIIGRFVTPESGVSPTSASERLRPLDTIQFAKRADLVVAGAEGAVVQAAANGYV